MRTSVLALLLACFAVPAYSQELGGELGQPVPGDGEGAVCADCPEPPPGGGGSGGGGGGGTTPAVKVQTHRIDAFAHTIELSLTNGGTIVIDDDLNKIFLSSATRYAELNLNTVLLQWANGNQTAANAMRAEIHAYATTPGFKTQIAKQATGLMMGPGGGYPPFNCNSGYTCYYVPKQLEGWGSYGFGFIGGGGGGGSAGSTDWQNWNRYRGDHCEAADENFVDAVESVGLMIVGCPFFETGVGAAACAIGGVSVVKNMNRAAKNSQVCHAPYPGPGQW